MKFAFIAAEKATFPVSLLCGSWACPGRGSTRAQARPPSPRRGADERLGLEIAAIHAESRQRYGSPRVHAELRERGQQRGPQAGRAAHAGAWALRPAPA